MQHHLLRHPDSPDSPVKNIEVDAVRLEDGRVLFMFMAVGDMDKLEIPPMGEATQRDELWQQTCFEAFVAPAAGDSYFELNFSPSRAWAAYRFDSYRSGMTKAGIETAEVERGEFGTMLTLRATVALGSLPELVPWESWRMGLSAVVKASDGSRSYWALAHPSGQPDFHHRDCFVANLDPAATL